MEQRDPDGKSEADETRRDRTHDRGEHDLRIGWLPGDDGLQRRAAAFHRSGASSGSREEKRALARPRLSRQPPVRPDGRVAVRRRHAPRAKSVGNWYRRDLTGGLTRALADLLTPKSTYRRPLPLHRPRERAVPPQ